MRLLPIVVVFAACAPPPDLPDTGLSGPDWGAAEGDVAAPPVWWLSHDVAGNEVGFVPDASVCPEGSRYLGGRDDRVACLASEPGQVAVLTRGSGGETLRVDGLDAVCPDDFTAVGQQGEAVVCWRPGVGRVLALTASEVDVGVGAPIPTCPSGWEDIGGQDRRRVCTRIGEGSVVRLSRSAAGLTVSDVQPQDVCPIYTTWLGRDRRTVLCDWQQPSTVVTISRGLGDPIEPEMASCPEGWQVLGGLERATVCGLETAVSQVSVTRAPETSRPVQIGEARCPEGYILLGFDRGAAVCADGGALAR